MRLSCQLLERHGLVKESLQLLLVSGLGARGRGGGAVPADVLQEPMVATHRGLSAAAAVRPHLVDARVKHDCQGKYARYLFAPQLVPVL